MELGGISLQEVIRRILSFLLTDSFARDTNLTGKHNKIKFGNEKLIDVIFGMFILLIDIFIILTFLFL